MHFTTWNDKNLLAKCWPEYFELMQLRIDTCSTLAVPCTSTQSMMRKSTCIFRHSRHSLLCTFWLVTFLIMGTIMHGRHVHHEVKASWTGVFQNIGSIWTCCQQLTKIAIAHNFFSFDRNIENLYAPRFDHIDDEESNCNLCFKLELTQFSQLLKMMQNLHIRFTPILIQSHRITILGTLNFEITCKLWGECFELQLLRIK